jgi:hypothetical protein
MDTFLEYIEPLEGNAFWVAYPYFLAGIDQNPPVKVNETINAEEDTALVVQNIVRSIEEGNVVYLYGLNDWSLVTIAACFVKRVFKFTTTDAIIYAKSAWLTNPNFKPATLDSSSQRQIEKYTPPITVIFCGDRNSTTAFEDMIDFELSQLPKYSVVVHGACRGVDLCAEELAKKRGIECRPYPVQWTAKYEPWRGPERNKRMLDCENPNLVLAFHPDIESSKGTVDMMIQAHKRGVPVYLHSLKRKEKFEGDFTVL